ncbi:MAG: hypothetical protein H6842_09390, partial [Rhodospirillaceae bacterium]|nr:hypothetical protein [Rhodospirillaceae bacterium]
APTAGDGERQDGWITVAGLAPVADDMAEARRLGCTHVWSGDRIVAVLEERSGR